MRFNLYLYIEPGSEYNLLQKKAVLSADETPNFMVLTISSIAILGLFFTKMLTISSLISWQKYRFICCC